MKIESTLPRRRCQCCGNRLDVFQQVMPRRTLMLVTCWTRGCLMFEFTLGALEHRRIAMRRYRRAHLRAQGRIVLRPRTKRR